MRALFARNAPRPPALRAAFALLVLLTGVAAPGARPAFAAVRASDDAVGGARPIAPDTGESLPAGAARFAAEIPANAARAYVVASTAPFATRDWKSVPAAGGAFRVADAMRGLVAFDSLGFALSAPTEIWWTVATIDRTTERLVAPAPRSFTVLPAFARPTVASPYLLATRTGTLEPGVPTAAPRLRLAAGFEFAPAAPGAAVPSGALAPTGAAGRVVPADPVGPDGPHAYLVQFATPPGDDERAAIARAGGTVVSYVPDQAFLVRMTPAARQRLADTGRAAWIGDYAPAFKLSPLLADPGVPATGDYLALVFHDGDARGVATALGARGYTVTAVEENGVNKLVRFRAPAGDLADAASLSEVAWVEPVTLKTLHNANAQWIVQGDSLNYRKVWTKGLRGLGQVVMTSDSGIDVTHQMFNDPAVPLTTWGDYPTHRKVIGYQPGGNSPDIAFGDHANGNSYHGTHTACSMVGNDSLFSTNLNDGMAKDAKIYFMDLSGPNLANSVVPFNDLNDLFQVPYTGNAGGAARVSSNSWGSNVNGAYDLEAMQVDQFVWAHPDFYVAFSAGNAGASGPSTVGSPATAKDCTSMGGVLNGPPTVNASTYYTTTSRGPTADGRIKPTLLAPASVVTSAQQGPSTYGGLSGTSMASPTGTGAVVLARQYLTDGWYPTGAPVPANGFTPSAALLKAMAINSGDGGIWGLTPQATQIPTMDIGFGRIDLDNVLYFPGDARKLLLVDNTAGLGQGQYIEYQVNVVDNTQPLKVSLCWSDYPGNPASAVQLVNNLDLYVKNGALSYKGNVMNGGVSVTGGAADSLNVEEECVVNAPALGVWTVRIAAPRVPIGPQPFGLVVTGGVGQAAGELALDRAEYGSTSTVQLRVVDTNAGPSSVNVNVASTTEPAGEAVTLTGANGVFTGSLPLTPAAVVAANGVLSVSSGDAITATYNDASPVAALVARATVSFAQPTITAVRAQTQGATGTLVTFNTPINATGKVDYGTTPALELGSVLESGARLAHQVLLTGLTPGTTYYYDVEATALNGNAVRDDLGGAHYKFTARKNGDVLLVVGEVGYPRLAAWEDALSSLGYDYDEWIGASADHPVLGDASSGMRGYRAVLWQAGIDQYPPFSAEQQTAVTGYLAGGGRLATIGHDIGWALGYAGSGFSTPGTQAWLANTLHTTFLSDPATLTGLTGFAGDPISGAYTGGVPYTPVRSGAAGDEVSVTTGTTAGTGNNVWNDSNAQLCGFRWEDAAPDGSAGTAVWAALPSRLATLYYEWTAVDPPFTSPSAIRNDILDKTLTWLMGRPRPTVTVTSPNGGEVVTTSPLSISWTEAAGSGRTIASRAIDYSSDGGDSWIPITASAGPSPYSWDLSYVPNSSRCLVRVRVIDDGAPSLSASDVSNAVFTVARPGGDKLGPVVVAGSIAVSPNPIVRPALVSLTASATDLALGSSNVTQAEWAFGDYAPLPGEGQPLTIVGSGTTVSLTGSLDSTPFLTGARKLWVRARDAAGNWGPASALAVQVNGPALVGVGAIPTVAFLAQNAPNPFAGATSVRFGLPRAGRAELAIYTVQGRLVRRLVSADLAAGEHVATWDARDEAGRRVGAGVYYAALRTPDGRFEKKMLALP